MQLSSTIQSCPDPRWLSINECVRLLVYKSLDFGYEDGMSRLPLPDIPKQVPLQREVVLLMESLQALPVTSTHAGGQMD